MNLLKLAYKNIIANPLGMLLSIILFALGIGLISFLLQFNAQLKDKFEANLADIDLVIGAKGSPLQLILSSMYHIDAPTGNVKIEDAKPFLNPKHPLIKTAIPLSLGDNYKSYRIIGTNSDILTLYNASLQSGNLFKHDLEVTIGKIVADDTGLKIGDKFVSSHGFDHDEDLAHDDAAFTVTGILAPSGTVLDQLILTTTSSIWNVHNHDENDADENHEGHDHEGHNHDDHDHAGHDHETTHSHDNTNTDLLNHPEEEITSLLIQYKNKTSFQALNMPRGINENTNLQAASPAYEINKLNNMVGIGTQTLNILALLIALVSAISIFLSLFKSLKERKYELALMRVMGGSKWKLFALVLLEGIILSIIGFLIGSLLAHLGMEYAAKYLKSDFRYSFTGWQFLKEEWWLAAVSLLIGIISALIPAWQASTTDINDTLGGKVD
jgi:putative ABC transport system permease protein